MSKSQSTRQKILDAALKLFSAKSFNGTTTKEIAAEACVAEGTIFRYFKTKKDILFNLAGPIVIESLTELMQRMAGADDETVLTTVLKNRMQIINQHIDLFKVILYESQFHPELREQFIKEIIMKAAGLMEQYISKKVISGEYRLVNPQIALRSLVGMMGIFLAWREFLKAEKYVKFDEEKIIDEIVKIFLYGVKNHQEKGMELCAAGLPPAFLFL